MITANAQKIIKEAFVTSLSRWCTACFAGFTFFSYGTAMMDYFLVYPSRLIIGEKEFVAYHALLEERILPISVIPFGLLTIFNILLFWFRPSNLPKQLVWASFICLFLDWLSTIFIQIPINLQLNMGKDEYLIRYIMETNWIRIALESAQATITLLALAHILPGKQPDK